MVMKNKLIPITKDGSKYQPAIVPEGYKYGTIIDTDGALRLSFKGVGGESIQNFYFRPALSGLVREGTHLPVLQSVKGGTYFVQNPTDYVVAAYREAARNET